MIKRHDREDGKVVTEFNTFTLGDESDQRFTFSGETAHYEGPLQGKWVFEYHPRSDYSNESVEAFYFVTNLEQAPLAEKYARLVQYSDCMIDTSTSIFKLREKSSNKSRDKIPPGLRLLGNILIGKLVPAHYMTPITPMAITKK
ncbi:hypothetical protein [Paraflavitalea speifideaquila]|uniref:hypothetical protein n=1 Tax=Paraflavitalea speifideaquila TaxID=3076558 RepID=UPI0028E3FAFC|nr:hypothetical protein [Paraflavitalea speifideiaquila]